jgi:hypothetical protein
MSLAIVLGAAGVIAAHTAVASGLASVFDAFDLAIALRTVDASATVGRVTRMAKSAFAVAVAVTISIAITAAIATAVASTVATTMTTAIAATVSTAVATTISATATATTAMTTAAFFCSSRVDDRKISGKKWSCGQH